jgi:hypothetical protein
MYTKVLATTVLIIGLFVTHFTKAQIDLELCDQAFEENSFQIDETYPVVRLVNRSELHRVLKSSASKKLNSPMFDGNEKYPVSCFGEYIFFPSGLDQVVVYDLSTNKEKTQISVIGVPAAIWQLSESIYVIRLVTLGISEEQIIVADILTGEVISNLVEGFQNQKVRLVVNQKILTETTQQIDGESNQVLIVYKLADKLIPVQSCIIKKLTESSLNFLPIISYAISDTTLYGLSENFSGINNQQEPSLENIPSEPDQLNDEHETVAENSEASGSQEKLSLMALPLTQCHNVASELLK